MGSHDDIAEIKFKALYDEYKNRLYGYVLVITHSPHVAEEITQEVFVKLWLHRDKLEEVEQVEPYVFRMARNHTLNYIRKASNDSRILHELQDAMLLQVNEVEDRLIAEDYESIVEEALSQLSPQRSLVFRLSRYQGLKLEEIAQQLHLSKNTVKNHLVAALSFIRTYLSRHGVTLLWLSVFFLKFF
ncbi:MAG: RNA polymerase sigma-70 factor [Thermoflavifilum aggregans]|nr:RNA polymerase sigma-70 factor [Thermoflavifilum aggregans]